MEKMFRSIGMVMASLKMPKIRLAVAIVSLMILSISAIPVIANGQGRDGGIEVRAFIALLNGGQEVPATSSNAFGVAFMTFDEDDKTLNYTITFTDDKLSGTETAAHFHAPANPGENAPVLFPVTPDINPIGSPKNGSVGPFTNKQRRDLRKGLFYINIHSSVFPGGEIRGQVLPVDGVRFRDVSEGG